MSTFWIIKAPAFFFMDFASFIVDTSVAMNFGAELRRSFMIKRILNILFSLSILWNTNDNHFLDLLSERSWEHMVVSEDVLQ